MNFSVLLNRLHIYDSLMNVLTIRAFSRWISSGVGVLILQLAEMSSV